MESTFTREPYLDNLVIGVECMFSWYWVADFCKDNNIEFILGHASYMKAIHGGKAKKENDFFLKNFLNSNTAFSVVSRWRRVSCPG